LVSDSKGLYDALNNELPQDDKKSAVEMPIIEEMLKRMNGRSRWVPHNFNPSDGLTKLKGAHMAPLIDLLKSGMYHLKTEEAQLKQRADEKASTGRTVRSKQSGKRASHSEPEPSPSQSYFVSVHTCISGMNNMYVYWPTGCVHGCDLSLASCAESSVLSNTSGSTLSPGTLAGRCEPVATMTSREEDFINSPDSDPRPADPGPAPDPYPLGVYICRELWSGFDERPKGYKFGVDPNDGQLEEDLYGLLGVTPDATIKEIKAGYHKMSLKFHPDKASSHAAPTAWKSRFLWIKNAYDLLKNTGGRAYWDRRLWLRKSAAMYEWKKRAEIRAAAVEKAKKKRAAERKAEEDRRIEESRREVESQAQQPQSPEVASVEESDDGWVTPVESDSDQDWGDWKQKRGDWWNQRNDDMGRYWKQPGWWSPEPVPPSGEASPPKREPMLKPSTKRKPRRASEPAASNDSQLIGFNPEVTLGKLQEEAEKNPEITSMLDANCKNLPWSAPPAPTTAPQDLEMSSWMSACKFYLIPDPLNVVPFLQLVWPGRGFTEIDTIRIALEKCLPGQVCRIPWHPIADLRDPSSVPRVSRRVPAGYGEDDQSRYFHGYGGLKAPLFRAWGALPSPQGAGCSEPRLYTCHLREVPIHSYSTAWSMPFRMADGTILWKSFQSVMGISSLKEHKYHDDKISRRDKYHHQFTHRAGEYEVLWTEWICNETDEHCSIYREQEYLDRDDKKGLDTYKRRWRQADELVWDFADSHYTIGEPPQLRPILLKHAPHRGVKQQSKEEADAMQADATGVGQQPKDKSAGARPENFPWRNRETRAESDDEEWTAPWKTGCKSWYYGAHNDPRARENQPQDTWSDDEDHWNWSWNHCESQGSSGSRGSGLRRDSQGREAPAPGRNTGGKGTGNSKGSKRQRADTKDKDSKRRRG